MNHENDNEEIELSTAAQTQALDKLEVIKLKDNATVGRIKVVGDPYAGHPTYR